MAVYKETIKLQSKGGDPTFLNITPEVRRIIAASGIQNGETENQIAYGTHCRYKQFVVPRQAAVESHGRAEGRQREFLQREPPASRRKIMPRFMQNEGKTGVQNRDRLSRYDTKDETGEQNRVR